MKIEIQKNNFYKFYSFQLPTKGSFWGWKKLTANFTPCGEMVAIFLL